MKKWKGLGIWMDHMTANLMEFTNDPIETKSVESKFTHTEKEESLSKSENVMHNKEQHEQATFYKQITEVIKDFDEVVLFGPTNAKVELANIISADHKYSNIKIHIQSTDKMTENQEYAFVRKYFEMNGQHIAF